MNTKIITLGIVTLSVLFNPLAGKDMSAAKKRHADRRASSAPYDRNRDFRPVREVSPVSSGYSSARGTPLSLTDEQAADALMSLDPVKSTERKIQAAKKNLDAMSSDMDRFLLLKDNINHFINVELKSSFEKRKMNYQ